MALWPKRPGINHSALKAMGFNESTLQALESALAGAFDIRFAFNKWTLGDEFCTKVLGFTAEQLTDVELRHADDSRLQSAADRRGEHLLLRRHDAGRRAAS